MLPTQLLIEDLESCVFASAHSSRIIGADGYSYSKQEEGKQTRRSSKIWDTPSLSPGLGQISPADHTVHF